MKRPAPGGNPARRHREGQGQRGQTGQAQIELIAAIPLACCVAVVVLQLLAVLYAQSLADGSAQAGAHAIAAGLPAEPAARAALPRWAESGVRVADEGGEVTVSVRPPSLADALGERLRVASSAWARPGEGG